MFWCKIFPTKSDLVVAICDEEIIDKEIKSEDFKMNIKISKHFYGGEIIDDYIAVKLMKKATIGNIIGKNIVELAEKNGFIIKKNVIFIDGIPHAQFVKL